MLNFDACNHICKIAEARVAKFCMQVEHISIVSLDDKVPLMTVTCLFFKVWPTIIYLELVKLGTSNVAC